MSLNFDEFQNIQQRLLNGGRLIFPDVFFQELTYMEQIVVLWKTKQNLLKAGDNITLHENEDGTVTISAGQGGEEESYRIEEVAPTAGNSKAYALINATTGEQSGSTIQIPTAIKGDKGDKGDTGNGIDSVTLAEELPTGNKYKIDMTDGTFYYFTAPKGNPGNPGEKGDDGFSPIAVVIPDSTGATVTITDENGTSSVHINNGEPGVKGDDGTTPDVSVNASVGANTGTPSVTVTKSGTAEQPVFTLVFDGLKGEQGIPGSGADGVGISNIALKESTAAGNTYTITLSNGQTYDFTAPVGPQSTTPGPKGDKGDPGTDGFSPIATATRTGNTVVISITDANGTTSGTVYDGVSPTITVTTITGGHQVEIVSAGSTERFDVMDGANGNDGVSPTVTVRTITGGHQIEIVSAGSTERFDVMDGDDGVGIASVTYNSQDAQGGNVYDVNLTDGTVAGQITAPKGAQGQTGPGIPAINSGDAGKVLTVNAGETGAEWATPSGGSTNFYQFKTFQAYPSVATRQVTAYSGGTGTAIDTAANIRFNTNCGILEHVLSPYSVCQWAINEASGAAYPRIEFYGGSTYTNPLTELSCEFQRITPSDLFTNSPDKSIVIHGIPVMVYDETSKIAYAGIALFDLRYMPSTSNYILTVRIMCDFPIIAEHWYHANFGAYQY